jgi:hypothetical protein
MDATTAVELTRAIREHAPLSLSEIKQAGEYGADSGWAGFIYTADGAEFTDQNAALLDEILQEDAEEFGHESVASFVASFNRADMADTLDGYKCLLAWYALEVCGRFWNDRAEMRTEAR